MVINNDIDQSPPTSPKPVTNLKSLSLNTSTVNEVQIHWIIRVSQCIPRVLNKVQKVAPVIDAEYIFKQVVPPNDYINTGSWSISSEDNSKKATHFLPTWDKAE